MLKICCPACEAGLLAFVGTQAGKLCNQQPSKWIPNQDTNDGTLKRHVGGEAIGWNKAIRDMWC